MSTAVAPRLLAALDGQVAEIADHLVAAALAALADVAAREDDLRDFTGLVVQNLVRHADGTRSDLDPAVLEYARDLARQGADGGAVAHLWRSLSLELWNWLIAKGPEEFDLRGVGMTVWNDFLATHERYATAFTDAFFETQTEIRGSELACRRASLDALLVGPPSEQARSLLTVLGIRSDRVLVARASLTEPAPGDPADPSAKFHSLLHEVRAHSRRLPWTVLDGRLILCLPDDERTKNSLERVSDRLGPNARIGISSPWSVTDSLSGADRQAELALRGTSANNPVVDFGSLSLVQIAALQVDLRGEDIPPGLAALLAEDARWGHEWVRTAETLANCHGSVAAAATALRVHSNTIYYRLTAARAVSGLDLRSPTVLADIQFVQASRAFGRFVP